MTTTWTTTESATTTKSWAVKTPIPLAELILTQPGILDTNNCPEHMQIQLIESYRAAHFTCKTSENTAHSPGGTRPGNSLADAIYNLSFAQPLKKIADYIITKHYAIKIEDPTAPLLSNYRLRNDNTDKYATDAAFVDDTLFLAQCPDNNIIEYCMSDLAANTHTQSSPAMASDSTTNQGSQPLH